MTHISQLLTEVLKEIARRAELRTRIEAERGQPMTDEEFIAIAEAGGAKI